MQSTSIHSFLIKIVRTQSAELDCTECASWVPEYVEAVLTQQDVDGRFHLVQDHLFQCAPCREEFEALRQLVAAEAQWLAWSTMQFVQAILEGDG